LAALRPFLGVAPTTAQRHAGTLIGHGLLGALATPFTSKGRPARLLYLTRLGLQTADNGGLYAVALARQLAAGKDVMTDRGLTCMPGLLAAYELLALLAGARRVEAGCAAGSVRGVGRFGVVWGMRGWFAC